MSCGAISGASSVGALRQGGFVDLALVGAQWAAVAGKPVQVVVYALGDLEERGLSCDHDPPCVDTGPAAVAEQWSQHLDHAAALAGRVDVPDHAAMQFARGMGDQVEQSLVLAGREHRCEALGRHRVNGLVLKGRQFCLLAIRSGPGGSRRLSSCLFSGTRRRAARRRPRRGSLGRRSWPGSCTARHRRSCASSHAGSFRTGFSAVGRRRLRS